MQKSLSLRRATLARRALTALAVVALAACGDAATGPLDPGTEPDGTDGPAAAPKHKAELVVDSPLSGAELSGVVELRARVEGRDPSTYTMNWRVDWGNATEMTDAGDGTMVATVDVSGWSWNGTGPYTLTFRAEDSKGRRVGEASLDVTVVPGDDAGDSDDTDEPSDTTTVKDDSTSSTNPLAGSVFWADPYSNAAKQADAWRDSRPEDAAYMDYMASGSQADWFGDWTPDVERTVSDRTTQIVADGALPVFVLYNIPLRDCSSYSGGGADGPDAYRRWIDDVAAGLGARKAVVIVEPDALAMLECLTAARAEERISLVQYAVRALKERTGATVYLDGGHPRWHSASTMASRLELADVALADGFALNVSNFIGDDENADYGRRISDLIAGAHFVIDTSRNGQGPAADDEWCNPDGRGLGRMATADTAGDRLDAFLWLKRPGESDGECNGGPRAGAWWADYALGLAWRASGVAGVAAEQ